MKRTELGAATAELPWLALSLLPNIGSQTRDNLMRHFGQDPVAVLAAPPAALLDVPGIGRTLAREIAAIDLGRVAAKLADWRRQGIDILTCRDPQYPQPLREIADAPAALFARGTLRPERTIAIVGTRQPSPAARFISLELARKLARAGYTIVSGLALGIDSAAHAGALAAPGRTLAVLLGSGLLNIYPESNRALARRIQAAGALLSETRPRWPVNAQRLVARNRIISGLSGAVILVESHIDGGAMYTARFARAQGRPVYTFDLPASGNQFLIKQGAHALKRDAPLDFFQPQPSL